MSNPTDFPEPAAFASGGRVKAVLEPIVKASIIVPESTYFHSVAFPARASWADFLARIVPPFCDPTPTPTPPSHACPLVFYYCIPTMR